PFVPLLILICLHESWMDAVIRRIPGRNQIEGWHVQTGRSCRVREPQRNHDEPFAFKCDGIRAELLGNDKTFRELIRKTRLPESCHVFRCYLFIHHLNCTRCGDKPYVWKAFQKDAGSKEVITMPMSGIDGCEILASGGDPIGLSAGLVHRDERID